MEAEVAWQRGNDIAGREGDGKEFNLYTVRSQRCFNKTQAPVGKINWRRHRPEAGPPMKKETLFLRGRTRRRTGAKRHWGVINRAWQTGYSSRQFPILWFGEMVDNETINKHGGKQRRWSIQCLQPHSIISLQCDFQKYQLTSYKNLL